MPRKKCARTIGCKPSVLYYKPTGIPMRFLEEVALELDELEAIRLADLESKYQEEAAKMMGISRQTFGRILESAHRKMADAILNGKAIRIGDVDVKHKSINNE